MKKERRLKKAEQKYMEEAKLAKMIANKER